jgi:hypothetical protein
MAPSRADSALSRFHNGEAMGSSDWSKRVVKLRATSRSAWLGAFLSFAIPLALITVATLNHYYGPNAYFWDSGYFAYQASFSTTWPMWMPPIHHVDPTVGRVETFRNHIMPIFFFTSALHSSLPFIPPAVYYSLLQGLWSGLLGLAIFIACVGCTRVATAVLVALLTSLCGPVLSAVPFPHVELAIPAFFLLFLALRSHGYRTSGFVALGLCLLVREDAGLHAGGVLILWCLAQLMTGTPREIARENLVVALLCFTYSFSVLIFKHLYYPLPISPLEWGYLGHPIGAHLNWPLVLGRVGFLLTERAYIVWPWLLILLIAAWRRNIALAVGPLAVVPWFLLSLLAVTPGPAMLWRYYAFPFIIALAWPSIICATGQGALRVQFLTSILSIGLFIAVGDWSGWDLHVPNFSVMGSYEAELRKVISEQRRLGRIMVDDAVVSLVPDALEADEWTFQWSIVPLQNPDAVVYRENAYDAANTERIVQESGLTQATRILNTPFLVAGRP